MVERPPPGKCVHCLQIFEELTWDHVFPESWYPETTPENSEKWKVPSCNPCNKEHGKNEAELLVRAGLCIDPDHPASTGIAPKVLRALNPKVGKNERDSSARASKCAQILQHIIIGPNIPRQAIYPGFGPVEDLPEKDQAAITISASGIARLTEKVVRGQTYLQEGLFLEETYGIENHVVSDEGASEFRQLLDRFGETYEPAPGLSIRRAVVPGDRVCGIFEIIIWEKLKLYATVTPKKSVADARQANRADGFAPRKARRIWSGESPDMVSVYRFRHDSAIIWGQHCFDVRRFIELQYRASFWGFRCLTFLFIFCPIRNLLRNPRERPHDDR